MAHLLPIFDELNLSSGRVARLRAAFWAVENALLTRAARRSRALAGSPQSPATTMLDASMPDDGDDSVRVLRWVFSRGGERLTCELALSDDAACYELRTVSPPSVAGPRIERFTEVTAAFQRQSSLEGTFVSEGWSLDSYESAILDRRGASS